MCCHIVRYPNLPLRGLSLAPKKQSGAGNNWRSGPCLPTRTPVSRQKGGDGEVMEEGKLGESWVKVA